MPEKDIDSEAGEGTTTTTTQGEEDETTVVDKANNANFLVDKSVRGGK